MQAATKLEPKRLRREALSLAEALGRRVEVTEKLSQALEAGAGARVRELMQAVQDSSREVNAAGEGVPELLVADEEVRGLLGQLVTGVQRADERLRAALERAGGDRLAAWLGEPSDETIIEELLAAPWDPKRDLVVLLGADAPRLVPGLRQKGQVRVFCQSTCERLDALAISRIEDLDAGCWRLGMPLPEQFRVRVLGAEPLPVEQVVARLQEALPNLHAFGLALRQQGADFLRRACRNLATIPALPSAARLDGLLRSVPAVIVAAGPSLDRNVARLRELKGKAVIIAINQTVRALRLAGVQPDIVLACDYQKLAYQFAGSTPDEIPVLGLGAGVDPELFRLPAQSVFTIASSPVLEGWIHRLLDEDASLPAGGTVAVSALHLAARMGCSPIITVGLDLALSGDKYYADGAADGGARLTTGSDGRSLDMRAFESKVRLGEPSQEDHYRRLLARKLELIDVPGHDGQTVRTTASMHRQLLALRAQLVELRTRARFFNCTEGGAFIEGMEHLPITEAIARCPAAAVDIPAVLRSALLVEPAPRCALMRERLEVLREDLVKVIGLAARCRQSLTRSRATDAQLVERLRRACARLPFARALAAPELDAIERATCDQALLEAERALYPKMEEEGATLIPLFDEAIRQLSVD